MKLKRKGGLTAGIITLSAVALTSVGFAAWVISAGDSTDITGNIEVDDVSESTVHEIMGVFDKKAGDSTTAAASVSSINGSSTQSIKFGAAVTKEQSNGKWLSNSKDTAYENLEVKFYVCVKNDTVSVGSLTAANYFKAGFAVKNASTPTSADDPLVGYSGYEGARKLGLIADEFTVTVGDLGGAEKNKTPGNETAALVETKLASGQIEDVDRTWYSVTITFKWGKMWDDANPYTYYNNMYSSSYINDILPFSKYSAYAKGDVVEYESNYYKCVTAITANTSGNSWNPEKWTGVSSAAYSNSTIYKTGDLVTYEEHTYKCKVDMEAAESWNAEHWTDISVKASDHAKKYLNALDKVLTGVGYELTLKTYVSSDDRSKDTNFKTTDDKLFVVAA